MSVYITANYPSSADIYHTNENCHQLKAGSVEKSRSFVEQKDMRLCRECNPEISHDRTMNEKTCKKCGETFKQIPNHIPTCDGRK